MVFQPVPEEVQDLHRYGHAARLEIALKREDAARQNGVLFQVLRQRRVLMLPHEPLLMREMEGGILHQSLQDSRKMSLALTGAHGCVQLVSGGEKVLVLSVNARDPNTVFLVPLEHTFRIGGEFGRFSGSKL